MAGKQSGQRAAVYPTFKRLVDIGVSGLALLLLSPFLVPIMLILKFTGEGCVFYTQERIGYRGEPFKLIKFATMLKNSPNIGTGTITLRHDPRVLPVGKFLRKTKLNELPQLLNVFLGDMSLVGPRPQTEECFLMFPAALRDRIYDCKPGLTGVGSIVFRNEEEIMGRSPKGPQGCYREDIMPYKAEIELWYADNQSLWLDAMLVLVTAVKVLLPKSRLEGVVLRRLPERPEALRAGGKSS